MWAPGSDLFQSIVQFKQKNCAYRSNSPIKYPRGRRQVATLCNTLHHTATAAHCNTLQPIAIQRCRKVRWHMLMEKRADRGIRDSSCQRAATHCNTLQHAATHCCTLQHYTTRDSLCFQQTLHYNTLQHAATHCNTLQQTVKARTVRVFPPNFPTQHAATRCNMLQHAAARYITVKRGTIRVSSQLSFKTYCQTTCPETLTFWKDTHVLCVIFPETQT